MCSVITTGSSSFIDQAKSLDDALKRIDVLEQRVAAFETTGLGIMYMCETISP